MGFFPSATYDLFLTHAWNYTDEWQSLVALLDEYLPGKWRNWSLPWHDTSIDRFSKIGRQQLETLLSGQIAHTSGVLVLPETMTRAEGRLWLDKELALAGHYAKPTIGVVPEAGGQFPDELASRVAAVVERDAARIIAVVNQLLDKAPQS